ncbi:MAG: Hint domain-containing protein, partial [Chloroflexota bacterium]
QVITPHEAKVTVKNYKVTKAIMDNRWDMIAQKLLGEQPTQTPIPPVIYSMPELRYRLMDNFGDVFYVDSDFYPVAREGQEERNAQEQFPTIAANSAEFAAILQRLGLPNKADYTLEEKVRIYREHKKLGLGVQVTASGDLYSFTLRVGEGQGFRIEGTITPAGKITVLKKEPSFNTFPICLTKGSLIDTPNGPLPVEQLRVGMVVWTADDMAERVVGTVVEIVMIPVPSSFQVVRVTLSDGRVVTASPGHPTIEKPALGDYRVGDDLDGALVVAVERVSYDGETYDILPAFSLPDAIGSTSSITGFYWVNGVLMISTLAPMVQPMGQDM